RHHRRLVNRLKAGALADRARLRFLHPGRTPAATADPGRGALVGADGGFDLGRLDAHGASGMLRHHLRHGEVDDRGADDRMPAFHRVPADGGAGDGAEGGSWRTYCSTFLKALPSSSVVLISMPSSRATDCATRRCDS